MSDYTNPADKILGVMPVVGFGTWEIQGQACTESVISALQMGYRHLDTAQIYGNEKEVGEGIRKSGIGREDIFLTTKIATGNLTPVKIRSTFRESLARLGTDYVDLLLIHWPTEMMDLSACLKTMFSLKEEGVLKHVGVSNFDPLLFNKASEIGTILTNQVKFTPYHEEFGNHRIAVEKNMIITAYSPLGRGSIANDQILGAIAEKYGKTASQVTLRWLIQMGNISVIPKAARSHHQKENIEIFDFNLSEEDMEKIRQLSRRLVWK
jgi:diketogulonate reductase-like aldo/keto reductase